MAVSADVAVADRLDGTASAVLACTTHAGNHCSGYTIRTNSVVGVVQPHSMQVFSVGATGPTADLVPVGVQVVAPFLRDGEAIRLAGILAAVSRGGYQVPAEF